MKLNIERAENGYVVSVDENIGRLVKLFVADDIAKVGELVVSQLAAAELDRQDYNNTVDKYGAVSGVAANIQKPLWQTPIHGAGARDDPLVGQFSGVVGFDRGA